MPGDDHRGTRDQRGGNTQTQDGKGGVDQKPVSELAAGYLALLAVDYNVESLKIMGLLVGGTDLANAVERLLNCLGNLDLLGTYAIEHRGHGAAC